MPSKQNLREIEHYLHEQIPLTRAMGVQVENYDETQLIVTAPLSLNHNHLGTAFGGSLSAIATLAGYGLLWMELGARDCHVIISKSTISFRRPVKGDIRAICEKPGRNALEAFKKKFAQEGKARINLRVIIEQDGMEAVDFEGTYVAKK